MYRQCCEESLKNAKGRINRARDAFRFSGVAGQFFSMPFKLSDVDAASTHPLFVLGNPRSGTTLLRELLNRNDDIVIPPENGALLEMFQAFCKHRRSHWDIIVEKVYAAFFDGYEFNYWDLDRQSLVDAARELEYSNRTLASLIRLPYTQYAMKNKNQATKWGDKSTPGAYEYLFKIARVFPQARYICIVRDGRDSVASCVRAGFYDKSHLKSAFAWSSNSRICRQLERNIGADNFLTIYYENLVVNPDVVLQELTEFLMLKVSLKNEVEEAKAEHSSDILKIKHHSNVMAPITSTSVGNWADRIPKESQGKVVKIMKNELRIHGYSL